jgi:hypothetical protein
MLLVLTAPYNRQKSDDQFLPFHGNHIYATVLRYTKFHTLQL